MPTGNCTGSDAGTSSTLDRIADALEELVSQVGVKSLMDRDDIEERALNLLGRVVMSEGRLNIAWFARELGFGEDRKKLYRLKKFMAAFKDQQSKRQGGGGSFATWDEL